LLQRVGANFHNPSFRGTSFSSDLNASFEHNSENPTFTDRIAAASFQLQKPLDRKKTQHLTLRYSFSRTQITNLLIIGLIPPDQEDVRLSTLAAIYSRDTRDNSLDAHRGSLQTLEVDLNPEVLGSSASFVKALAQVARYRRLAPSDVIWANSVRLGFAQEFAGSFVPLSQQFFTGGGSTLRGFPLNGAGPQHLVQACPTTAPCGTFITAPTGGNQLLIVNSEFRIPVPIWKGFGVVAFYDGGNVFANIGFHGQYTNSVGGGLRYATPVGPIRFDIGHNLNTPPGITSTQYFITIGQAF
jgi:outer membrane protein insertion porin family